MLDQGALMLAGSIPLVVVKSVIPISFT